jgi:CDP-4-dehydro-6-deoxyglucose reductase
VAEKTAILVGRRSLTPDVFWLHLAMREPAALAFRTGQFVSVRFDDKGDVRRSYSIASRAHRDHEFELVVKRVPGGVGSEALDRLAPGDALHFTGPLGFFTLAPAHLGDVAFVATGVGAAPVFALLDELGARGEPGRAVFFWGLRRQTDAFHRDHLERLAAAWPGLEVHIHLTQPGPDWRGGVGRVTAPAIERIGTLTDPTVYLCGHGAMVDEIGRALRERGVPRRHIHGESFWSS